jgi:hypothetical protein
MSLGVECLSSASDGETERRRGTTQDVSAGGVNFQTAFWRGLEVGKIVMLQLSALSKIRHGSGSPRVAKTFATIRRIIVGPQDSQAPAFAYVAAEFHERPFTEPFRLAG